MSKKQIHMQQEVAFTYTERPKVELIRVIKTSLTEIGEGTKEDPIRIAEQYWSLDGKLLWEKDTLNLKPKDFKVKPDRPKK